MSKNTTRTAQAQMQILEVKRKFITLFLQIQNNETTKTGNTDVQNTLANLVNQVFWSQYSTAQINILQRFTLHAVSLLIWGLDSKYVIQSIWGGFCFILLFDTLQRIRGVV